MTVRTLAASALLFGALAALDVGCSKEEPQCEKDAQCTSANTACTRGVCREGVCHSDPLPERTLVPDQSPVKDKYCVELRCDKAGKAVEVPLGSKVPMTVIPCKKQECDGTTLKTTDVLDGVPCDSGNGTCRGGVCRPNEDSGPPPGDTGAMDSGVIDAGGD